MAHGVRRGGDRQDRAVAVVDGPPRGGDSRAPCLLLGGPRLQLLPLVDGQVVRFCKHRQERRRAEQQQQIDGPPLDDLLGLPDGIHRPFRSGWFPLGSGLPWRSMRHRCLLFRAKWPGAPRTANQCAAPLPGGRSLSEYTSCYWKYSLISSISVFTLATMRSPKLRSSSP